MDLAQKPVYKLDLAAGTSVVNLTTPLVEGDDRAQTFTLELTDKGAPANLNGYSVTAYFGRGKTAEAEADTIPLFGTVSGNVATITLTESCYSRSCYFSMPIRLSNSTTGQKRTYLIVRGTVVKSVDGRIIDPDGSVPSLDDLFAQIAVMERSRQAAEDATEEALTAAARADEAREGIQGDLAALTKEMVAYKGNIYSDGYDFNTAPANSFFYMLSKNAVNAPPTGKTTAFGFLVCYKSGENFIQIYTDFDDGKDYIRYGQGNAWAEWKSQKSVDALETDFNTLAGKTLQSRSNVFNEGYDFNSSTPNSFFYMLSKNAVNAPPTGKTTAFGLLVTYKVGTTSVQVYTDFDDGKDYIRYFDGSSWTSWKPEAATEENGAVYVSTAEELYNTVRGMGENTHVFINPGTYDISAFIEADATAQMNVKKGCVIEGLGVVKIICHKTTPSDVPSIFNFVRGDGEIKNLHLEGSNIRYLVHDDMGGTSETPATHKITNCVLNYVGKSWDGFAHPRCIGGGTGNNVVSIIENCVLTDTNDVCIDYHSNFSVQSGVQPTAGGKLIITNCYSATSRIHLGSLTGDLGENPTVAMVSNNCMGSELTHSGNAFVVKAWNNVVTS